MVKNPIVEELIKEFEKMLLRDRLPVDVSDSETGQIIIPAFVRITKPLIRQMAKAYKSLEVESSQYRPRIQQMIDTAEEKFKDQAGPDID